MRFTTRKQELQGLLQRMLGVTASSKTIPILANTRISAVQGPGGAPGMVSMTATDMEIAVTSRAACECSEAGEATVPAAVAAEIVRRVPDDAVIEVWTEEGGDRMGMRAGRFETSIHTLPVADFPELDAGKLPHVLSVQSSDLARIFDNVRAAMSTEQTRYYLCGIYLEPTTDASGAEVLRGVATDGHRLVVSEMAMPGGKAPEGMPAVIIPRTAVALIRKMLDDSSPEASLEVSETRLRITAGPLTLVTKLIDGTYPDYRRIIPQPSNKVLRTARKALTAAVGRVGAIGTERSRPVVLQMDAGGLTVRASSPEMGEATEELEPTDAEYAGPTSSVGFQVKYLEEMLAQTGDRVEFYFGEDGASAPALILDPAHPGMTGLLMPMRV